MSTRIKRLALPGLAVLVGLVAFLWLRTRTEDDSGLAPLDPVAAQRDSAAVAVPHAQDEGPAALAAVVGATTRRAMDLAAEPVAEPVTLRGRCIAAEDLRPLAGVAVSVSGEAPSLGLASAHEERPLDPRGPLVTGEDGRFELRITASPYGSHRLSLQRDGRAPRHLRFGAFAHGTLDLGDLSFARGFDVGGFVTDPQGGPVAGVGISLRRQGSSGNPWIDAPEDAFWGHGLSDAAGTFTIRNLEPGTFLVVADSAFDHVSPKEVEVRPEAGASAIHVVVRRRPSIEGTIVDENGAPVDLGSNLIAWERNGQSTVSTTIGTDGVFRLCLVAGSAEAVQIGWESWTVRTLEDFRTAEWIEWGARGVRLVAKRLPALEVEVVEAETGKPVEEFAVRTRNEKDPGLRALPGLGRSPGGRARIEGLVAGETIVEVIPKRTDLLISAPVQVFVSVARGPVRIELLRATSFSVRVLFADRSPVPGSTVELIDPRRFERITHETTANDDRLTLGPGGPGARVLGENREEIPSLLSWGTTDAQGRIVLHGPATGARFALRVSSPTHELRIVDDFRTPSAGTEAEVFVAAGAGLDFIASPPVVARCERNVIRLRKVGGDWPVVYPGQNASFPLAPDGIVRARRIPAGTWEVMLSVGGIEQEPPIATVTLAEGKTTRLEVDLARFVPARLSGKVLWNGARPVSGSVTLAAKFVQLTVPLDAAGRFVAERVLPGTYELSAALTLEREQVRCAYERFVELAPGADLDIDFDLRPRTLHLRVLQHDGAPARNVLGDVAGGVFTLKFVTDSGGEALVSPVPGPKVRVTASNQVVFDGEIPAGPDPELTVRLPEPEKK